jgi:hypothetical protein
MHLQPLYASAECFGGSVAEDLFARGICLPQLEQPTEAGPRIGVIAVVRAAGRATVKRRGPASVGADRGRPAESMARVVPSRRFAPAAARTYSASSIAEPCAETARRLGSIAPGLGGGARVPSGRLSGSSASAPLATRAGAVDIVERLNPPPGRLGHGGARLGVDLAHRVDRGGAVIRARAVVQTGARIGAHCVVNTGAIVEHDVELGKQRQLAPWGHPGRWGAGRRTRLRSGSARWCGPRRHRRRSHRRDGSRRGEGRPRRSAGAGRTRAVRP